MAARVLEVVRSRLAPSPVEAGEWLIAGLVALGLALALFV